MDDVTPQPQRTRLAQRHLSSRALSETRSQRQQLRLHGLRLWGRRYQPSGPVAPPARPRQLLVVRPDHLGDLLFVTPALRLLRQQHPEAQITALVGPWGRAVLAANRDVDQVLTCPFPGFTRQPAGNPLTPYRLLRTEARRLGALGFDLALIQRFDHWWGAWLAAAAGIPHRVGFDIAEVVPFLTQAVTHLPGRHEVVQNLALALAAGRDDSLPATASPDSGWQLHFSTTADDEAAAQQLLAPVAVAGRRLVAIHPGSGAAVKRWRTPAWASLVRELAQRHDVQVVLTGTLAEADLAQSILSAAGPAGSVSPQPVSLAGQTSLGALAAVYRRCSLVIGPDSGPLHLAVAVGTPTVHLYGPVDHRVFGPWGSPQRHRVVRSDWACMPCNHLDWPQSRVAEHGCLRDITLTQVSAAAATLLEAAAVG